ncbi:hypothetical protein GGTG_03265 [Gaeumannomyces tritici R3-111a-1]|uniref:Extracelular serine carboxypeptidase n=1 Tax=Gaeumannomyces tritici (strain R3-111a-1) TaxID=644352 RepID=J3NPQ8_GAET3|nr:hypothetical protein GGTG_03265 [Gaeumannomyces tritici R3-111a-1]EJT78163.1 hypothetical protein GGTG_03265 [Gaeumannomyces tritici R3-111a-1]
MLTRWLARFALSASVAGDVCAAIRTSHGISDYRRERWARDDARAAAAGPPSLEDRYPARSISVPIDHFHNESSYAPHSDEFFQLRYWFDASYYRDGGPIIVLLGGETSGADRLPFMEKGILAKLAEATGGVSVILEHRYYGESFPVPDLSISNLRFLTTDQALADTAFFARNVIFEGFEDRDLTSGNTPYFTYGGSYAGAFAAFLRKLYPEDYWGAISSSGVTLAVADYWQYYEAQRLFAPPDCVVTIQKLTHVVDNIVTGSNKFTGSARLRDAFGLPNVTYLPDFVNVLANGIKGWQELNWDLAVSNPDVYQFCNNITSDTLVYPQTERLTPAVRRLLEEGGYGDEVDRLAPRMLNYIGFVNLTEVAPCARRGQTQESCFGNRNLGDYKDDDITQTWRSWEYQVCTQWGYFLTGASVPQTQLPLVSRLLDIDYLGFACEHAFNITKPPDVESINKHGGLNFSYPRVALIDGEADPWLWAGTHAPEAPARTSTASEPFILIKGKAVHHWDENGLLANETTAELPPRQIVEVQRREMEIVREWMKEWHAHKKDVSPEKHVMFAQL